MNIRLLSFIVLCVFLFAGCSGTQKLSGIGNLQIKVSHLERKLNQRDEEIEKLKYEVKGILQEVEGLKFYREEEFDVGLNKESIEEPGAKNISAKQKVKKQKKSIIRVPVRVKKIQEALKKADYYDGFVDGKLGDKSRSAIIEFQKDHDLVADGIIGKKTWNEMKVYLE